MSIENKEILFKTLPLQTNKIFSNKLYYIPPFIGARVAKSRSNSFSNSGGIDKNLLDFETVKFYHLF